ncbi:hypothetical protein AMC83_CH01922 [Rhizobium phaseoli]|uniref:hypothetical protein n=1 Tax=Rhizobium phaseoli TaxID=396 RepID=UPI0007EAD338|nr:hypothetical protein [Rhizobium phaseoli]ANL71905.1 hypothetical protein AMC83_CH01922 [Rhizobium phaseoli]
MNKCYVALTEALTDEALVIAKRIDREFSIVMQDSMGTYKADETEILALAFIQLHGAYEVLKKLYRTDDYRIVG